MRVLVIAGRMAREPWTAGGFVARVCRGLIERGHAVSLAAQSVADAAGLADVGVERVSAFEPFLQTSADWPLGFGAWARRRRGDTAHDASISFARVAGADVWFPAEPGAASWLARAATTRAAHDLALAVGRHHGVFRPLVTEAFFRGVGARDLARVTRRVIAVGPTSAGEAARRLATAGLGERVVRAPYFGMVEPPGDARGAELRRATRAMLNIGPERRVILASAVSPIGGWLDNLLAGVADRASRDPERGPLLLALARECFPLHTRAVRLGAERHVRIIGTTARMDAALSAADLCAVPIRSARGPFESGALARFSADSLRFGRPLLVISGAPGYDLARQTLPDSSSPGLVVEGVGGANWERTLRKGLDGRWLEDASRAARAIGKDLTFDRLLDTLEGTLNAAREEREAGVLAGE